MLLVFTVNLKSYIHSVVGNCCQNLLISVWGDPRNSFQWAQFTGDPVDSLSMPQKLRIFLFSLYSPSVPSPIYLLQTFFGIFPTTGWSLLTKLFFPLFLDLESHPQQIAYLGSCPPGGLNFGHAAIGCSSPRQPSKDLTCAPDECLGTILNDSIQGSIKPSFTRPVPGRETSICNINILSQLC